MSLGKRKLLFELGLIFGSIGTVLVLILMVLISPSLIALAVLFSTIASVVYFGKKNDAESFVTSLVRIAPGRIDDWKWQKHAQPIFIAELRARALKLQELCSKERRVLEGELILTPEEIENLDREINRLKKDYWKTRKIFLYYRGENLPTSWKNIVFET